MLHQPQLQPSFLKKESWQLDSSGLYFYSPSLSEAYPAVHFGTTVKSAGNMADDAQRLKAFRRLDIDARRMALSYQAHGTDVHIIRQAKDIPVHRIEGVDGWITSHASGASIGVFTADCLPVFLIHKDRHWGALLHAGWKGLKRGILEEAIGHLSERCHCRTEDIISAIGPHVRSCCYEVGADLRAHFPEFCFEERQGKIFLNLELCAADKLSSLGVREALAADICTRCSPEFLFFSYRRGDKGSQLSFLSLF